MWWIDKWNLNSECQKLYFGITNAISTPLKFIALSYVGLNLYLIFTLKEFSVSKIYFPKPTRQWTPRYIRDRIALYFWQKRHTEAPWLVSSVVHFLEGWLKPTDDIVEFGSGRSTLWFSQRVRSVLSVEHNKEWYESVQSRISARNISNVKLIYNSQTEEQYVSLVQEVYPDTADMILVDANYRDHCVLWALEHLRPGGILVLDNAARFLPSPYGGSDSIGHDGKYPSELWQKFAEAIENKRKFMWSNGVFHTMVVFV